MQISTTLLLPSLQLPHKEISFIYSRFIKYWFTRSVRTSIGSFKEIKITNYSRFLVSKVSGFFNYTECIILEQQVDPLNLDFCRRSLYCIN